MNGWWQHFGITLRLHFRNRMALLYGYLFPLIFLVAFWVLFRHEKIPLLRHMGELLTVSVLGGACFGLPTTLVSEREKGVWRRYRLAPVPIWTLVGSTIAARYLILLSAGLLQLGVALAVGMTLPEHPVALFVAFTLVAWAFIGLGLVIAMLADTVPAVQALGQCIFLPMLIIGGVAVQLASLPAWAQHVSAFFPGRYAVEAIQAAVTGPGLMGARFCLLALALTGVAGLVAGAKLFRWDTQPRETTRGGKAWILPVLAAWLAVGLLAEWRGRIAVSIDVVPEPAAARPAAPPPPPWEKITAKDVAALDFRVPSDHGVVAPFAPPGEEPEGDLAEQVEEVRRLLATWSPAQSADAVQRVRNLLYVAAVPDVMQAPAERYLPGVVLEHLAQTHRPDQLIKILTWIVQHPKDGEVITELSDLGIPGEVGDRYEIRVRTYLYAVKFIARLTGRVPRQ